MKEKRNKIFWWIIWGSIGMLISMIVSIMIISGRVDFNRFYDIGKVCDIFQDEYQVPGAGVDYNEEKGVFYVKVIDAYKYIDLYQMEEYWKYIIVDISKLSTEELRCCLVYFDNEKNAIDNQEISLKEGENIIEVKKQVEYSGVSIMFLDVGTEFFIEDMQFRTSAPIFSWYRFVQNSVIIMCLYTLVSLLAWLLFGKRVSGKNPKINWYAGIAFAQGAYCIIGENYGAKFEKISEKNKSRCRIGLFLFMLMYMQIVMDLHIYEQDRYYKYHILVCVIVVFFIALFCTEGRLCRKDWKNKLVGSWYLLWIIACISDFFVKKRYTCSGYVMIFAVGFFFFMWNNMRDRSKIVKEFMMAIKISFVINMLFCIICRPEIQGVRYNGCYYNPGMFAMYLLYVWIVLLQEVDEGISRNKRINYYVKDIVLGAVLLTFLWKTQSTSGIIPVGVVMIIFILKQITEHKKARYKNWIVAIVLGCVVSIGTSWALNTIPWLLNTEINFENDAYAKKIENPSNANLVYANEIEESRIFKKIFKSNSFEKFTTGRSLYWLGYLREMNLWGNENKVHLWGGNRWPHNGFIAMAYRYGVFAVIPYAVMIFSSVFFSWKYFRRGQKFGLFIFAGNVCALLLIIMENLELPFLFLCWFFMYLMMGVLFEQTNPNGMELEMEKE